MDRGAWQAGLTVHGGAKESGTTEGLNNNEQNFLWHIFMSILSIFLCNCGHIINRALYKVIFECFLDQKSNCCCCSVAQSWLHGLYHARLPCPALSPRACSNSMSVESVMQSNHLVFCYPLLLPSIFPSIRAFSNEWALHIRGSTGEGNGKPLQHSCLENCMNSMKRQKHMTLKNELPRLVGAQYATGEEQRYSFRRNKRLSQSGNNAQLWCVWWWK